MMNEFPYREERPPRSDQRRRTRSASQRFSPPRKWETVGRDFCRICIFGQNRHKSVSKRHFPPCVYYNSFINATHDSCRFHHIIACFSRIVSIPHERNRTFWGEFRRKATKRVFFRPLPALCAQRVLNPPDLGRVVFAQVPIAII